MAAAAADCNFLKKKDILLMIKLKNGPEKKVGQFLMKIGHLQKMMIMDSPSFIQMKTWYH